MQDIRSGALELSSQTLPIIEQMAEQLPGGFLLYQENENRDILYINRTLLEMYECDSVEEFHELTGSGFHGMVYPDDVKIVQESIDRQIKGEHGSYDHVEYRIVTKSGKIRWIDDYGHFSHSEEFGDVFYVFLFDISDKRKAQNAESRFFYRMSNDVLTPMNAVSSYIKLAMKHMDERDLLEKYLKNADAAAERMTLLIDNIVDIHREIKEEEPSGEITEQNRDIRVLVADDNELNRMLLETILEEAGFVVKSVDDGDKAVEKVKAEGPGAFDVILMDIQMKRMDGYEATRQIRKLPYGGADQLPIMAISANSRDEDRQKSRECGMNEHLEKPYNPEKIIRTIYRYVRD